MYLLAGKLALLIFDHALYHVAADIACVLAGDIAVIAFLEVYANFVCDLVLEVIQVLLGSVLCRRITGRRRIFLHRFYLAMK